MTQTTLNYLQNRNLFSNHYLESLIVDEPVWQEDVTETFNRAKEIYSSRKDRWKNLDESMLEQFLIKPILEEVLGHYYIPQAKVEKGSRRPDYAFFESDNALSEALENKESDDIYLKAIAVGDAKKWRVLLDKKVKGSRGSFEFQNPSYQIDQYLHLTQVQWGILTNGHHWRIYYRETSYKLDSYYDIDLVTILETNDIESFKYFYLFFRLEAFTKGPDGKNFLDRVNEGSIKYAKELGDNLQRNVYEAMKILSEGFFEWQENNLTPNEHDLKEVQINTLKLLYRLLFIFYAESRKLLDIDKPAYQALSLESIKYDIADKIDNRELILPVTMDFWSKLDTLFSLINEGSESEKFRIPKETLYIPAYNGGLFDYNRNPFLHDKKIGDEYIARAIDCLSREGNEFIDYSTLGTRQLGSIYEGLLEYKLKVADEDLIAIKEKGREKWIPKKDAQTKKIFDEVVAGEIYLATDKGERKATGSYYTPDYIVKYIVRNTLEPILEEKRKSWGESGLGERPFLHDILDIKVLDPAMGSGHFLVETCEFLANRLVDAWGEAQPEDLESEEVAEHDVHWARREVVRHCIYGVDLNPMAVELAKLSLWLETVATNKPLTFLDHHLKVGNSLIGAKVKNLKSLPSKDRIEESETGTKQPTLWDFTVKQHFDDLIRKYGEFASHPDDDLKCVKQKEEEYDKLQKSELNMRIHELANVWVSTYFGVEPPPDEYADLQNEMNPKQFTDWSGWRELEWFRMAQEIAGEKSFFHWELEFPDVFYEKGAQKKNPGWDAVVGNPPYLPTEEIEKTDAKYYQIFFNDILYRKFDSSVLFINIGLRLNKRNGYFGMITPVTWQTGENYGKFREFTLKTATLKSIVNLPFDVFSDAYIDTCVEIFEKNSPNLLENPIYFIKQFRKKEKITPMQDLLQDAEKIRLNHIFSIADFKIFPSLINYQFLNKLKSDIILSLGELTDSCQGIVESFYNYSEKPETENHIPYVNGHGYRYEFQLDSAKYIDFSTGKSLLKYYTSPRILIRRIISRGNRLMGTYVFEPFVCKKDLNPFIVVVKEYLPLYLLANLNSTFHSFLYVNFSTLATKDDFRQTTIQELRNLPIRRISFTTPPDRRTALVDEAKALYTLFLDIPAEPTPMLDFVAERLGAEPEESDVMHDLLAHLAECMIEMNNEKNAEIKAFLNFLEGETGAAVDDMTNKKAIREYYKHEFQKLIDIMVKNKKKLKDGYDPKSPTNYKHLNEWYNDSTDKLQPLMDRIKATDRLIDQIVYKLYGLTSEEIKIVEESIA